MGLFNEKAGTAAAILVIQRTLGNCCSILGHLILLVRREFFNSHVFFGIVAN